MTEIDITHTMTKVGELEQRAPRHNQIIKRANTCANCERCARPAGRYHIRCTLHNVEVDGYEWCKYHERKA